MDFFEQQERARKRSRWLICCFAVAMLLKLVFVCLVVGSICQVFLHARSLHPFAIVASALNAFATLLLAPADYWKWLWDPELFAIIAGVTLLSVMLGSWYKIHRLAADGGCAVAELLGGRRVEPAPTDIHEQRLRDVVEEMAIASGMPVPEIYVLDNERGINSFAAGATRNDVAIGVTRGCVQSLTRDELQGLVAHEFSHILNGDTRLNMQLMGILHGMLWPSISGRVLVYGDDRTYELDDRSVFDMDLSGRQAQVLLGLILMWVGALSLPFARWVKSAICRKRELLADAAAVQFTRNPAGVAGALKKVGGLIKKGRLDSPQAETASHLYVANFKMDPWLPFLSSHPPLLKRICAIEPTFDGRFPFVRILPPSEVERERLFEEGVRARLQMDHVASPAQASVPGQFTAQHIREIGALRLGLPPEIATATKDPLRATALIYALLLDPEEPVRSQQLQLLKSRMAAADYNELARQVPLVTDLDARCRLPMIDLSIPALRLLDPTALQDLLHTARALAEADGAIDLFEYALLRILHYRLEPVCAETNAPRMRFSSAKPVLAECCILLSALAWLGREDEGKVRTTFQEGSQFLDAPGSEPALLPRSECSLDRVDQALQRLTAAAPYVKRNILLACAHCVASDRCVDVREMELLRAIADTLESPIPPFVEALQQV